MIPVSWDSCLCEISSPPVWAGPRDLLLRSGIQQKTSGTLHSSFGNRKDCGFCLTGLLWWKPAAMLWEAHMGKKLREIPSQQPVQSWRPKCNNPWGTESSYSHVNLLGSGNFRIQPWDGCSPRQRLCCNLERDPEDPAKRRSKSPRNRERNVVLSH